MNMKIINIIIDIALIAIVFAITDHMTLKVFQSDSLWLEVGIYIVFYGIVFGAKSGITHLWKKNVKKNSKEEA